MGLFSRGEAAVTEQQVLAALSTVQEPELGGEINHQGRFAAWTRILNEGWIRRWLSA